MTNSWSADIAGPFTLKYNVRKESLELIVKSRLSPFSSMDSMQGVGKREGKGENPRLRNTKKEVRDPDVKRELRKGGKLITYVER